MRRPKIYIMYNSDSSPSCDSHAAIHVMPKNKNSGFYSFGIFPFPMSSSVPDTSVTLLMKNATSIYVSVFKQIITPRVQ